MLSIPSQVASVIVADTKPSTIYEDSVEELWPRKSHSLDYPDCLGIIPFAPDLDGYLRML